MYFDQSEFDIRCEWGMAGVSLLAPTSDAVIIVDVISFTTAVDVAVSRGGKVYPFAWKDERAADFARERGALLAVASRRDPNGYSLAPTSLMRLPPGAGIVLPSPNGSALSLAVGSTPAFAGCLRNAAAVARAAAALGRRLSVIPAGERWPDGGMRPALEDLLGAGAIIHHLRDHLPGSCSPEAEAAEAAFLHFRGRLHETLAACSSGKEAADRGSVEDVRLMSALNVSSIAPQLVDGAYENFSD